MKIKINKNKQIIKATISVILITVLFILASYIFKKYDSQIESLIKDDSILGMLFFVFIFILSIVFAPISAVPLIPIATNIWGVFLSAILSIIGWTIGAMIAFELARKFGRPLVSKFISLKRIEKIEKIIGEHNIFLSIFLLRSITPIDGVSYILGLISQVKTKTFFFATFLGLIPFCFMISYLGSLPTIFLIIGSSILLIFFLIIAIKIYINPSKNKQSN